MSVHDTEEITDMAEDQETRARMNKLIRKFLRFITREDKANQTKNGATAVKARKKSISFTCNVCRMSFKHKHHILRHTQMHLGVKSFQCNICKKWFRDLSNLSNHKYTHTGEKKFKCSECGKTFMKNDNLKAHSRTHSLEKPYSCYHCKKPFTTNGNLTRHVRNVHKCI